MENWSPAMLLFIVVVGITALGVAVAKYGFTGPKLALVFVGAFAVVGLLWWTGLLEVITEALR